MKCKYCIEKEKDWKQGNSPIKCAFEDGVFSEDNWNCGTMDYLREMAEENSIWNNDINAGLIPYCLENEEGYEDTGFIYLEWYKSRGTTDSCIDMYNKGNLTLNTAYKIIKDYE